MTAGGWVCMVGSVSFVWGLAIWSYYKVFTVPQAVTKPPDSLGG